MDGRNVGVDGEIAFAEVGKLQDFLRDPGTS